jgi:hypothetical protein
MSTSAEEKEALTLAHLLQADGLPGVFCSSMRPWRDIADEALSHLALAKTPLYVRQGELVRIVRKEDGTPAIEAISDPAFKDILAHAMNFVRIGGRGPIHIPPPDDIVRNLVSRPSFPFAPLEAVIEFPSSGLMARSFCSQAMTEPPASTTRQGGRSRSRQCQSSPPMTRLWTPLASSMRPLASFPTRTRPAMPTPMGCS